MKVLLINGSPHPQGCTYTALREVADTLEAEGIETEIFQIGKAPVRGCIACRACARLGKCVFDDDPANELIAKLRAADGVVVGSPVYYAGPNGALCALLDRVFYAGGDFSFKPAAAVVSARRSGTTAAFDRLNKYFTISKMPVVTSQYWNAVHGITPEDVKKDIEGLQVMRVLGRNMAWMLKTMAAAHQPTPEPEPRQATNFIRE